MRDTSPLKLRAHDGDDLATLALFLQDALVPLTDIAFLESEKRFVMVVNRFKWERDDAGQAAPQVAAEDIKGDADFYDAPAERHYQRVNCGVCFDWVRHVRSRGLDRRSKDQILNLLTIKAEPGAVTLIFSDGATIRLDVSGIRCHLEDLGEPWPTPWRPTHGEADQPPPAR